MIRQDDVFFMFYPSKTDSSIAQMTYGVDTNYETAEIGGNTIYVLGKDYI